MVFLRRFEIPACVGVLALAFAVAANAQVTTGTIFGRVADSTGAVVPGATVTATNGTRLRRSPRSPTRTVSSRCRS